MLIVYTKALLDPKFAKDVYGSGEAASITRKSIYIISGDNKKELDESKGIMDKINSKVYFVLCKIDNGPYSKNNDSYMTYVIGGPCADDFEPADLKTAVNNIVNRLKCELDGVRTHAVDDDIRSFVLGLNSLRGPGDILKCYDIVKSHHFKLITNPELDARIKELGIDIDKIRREKGYDVETLNKRNRMSLILEEALEELDNRSLEETVDFLISNINDVKIDSEKEERDDSIFITKDGECIYDPNKTW